MHRDSQIGRKSSVDPADDLGRGAGIDGDVAESPRWLAGRPLEFETGGPLRGTVVLNLPGPHDPALWIDFCVESPGRFSRRFADRGGALNTDRRLPDRA